MPLSEVEAAGDDDPPVGKEAGHVQSRGTFIGEADVQAPAAGSYISTLESTP